MRRKRQRVELKIECSMQAGPMTSSVGFQLEIALLPSADVMLLLLRLLQETRAHDGSSTPRLRATVE